DSTDAWFGTTAASVDTAGLDSALAAGLLHGGRARARRRLDFGWGPALGFNRVDGGQLGLSASLGRRPLGPLSGQAQDTTGTPDQLGEGAGTGSWGVRPGDARL